MLYLAQVTKNTISEKLELNLLAVEESKLQWTFCHEKFLSLNGEESFPLGLFLLVELDHHDQIIRCRDAKDWILNLIREYLVEGHSNHNINIPEEQARIEKWRQELTSQSQDLTRLRLEIETRREELQELEQNLHIEREKLKSINN
ncbi:hypothetical protein GM3708_1290 [Geminocystis sp. NIES-3708]|uniref:hypothetical protein n=1 Tax=Geminocystis sp. NIES-3708 TaxID=1615909 RepID=UPI0005FCCEE5|nr:hypothetical protein [Geminocystis sp. NIES-3708]BAQ60884.1 hypothetical protein GM3708_1290 [Geminocystis sp. NIES-3708]